MQEFLFLLFVLLAVAWLAWRQLAEKKRREALARWARAQGLRFHPERDRTLAEAFPDFPCLWEGGNRYGFNLIHGELEGRELLAFDYHYETYSTDARGRRQTHHHYFSALILKSPVVLEPLLIRPEGFLDRVAEFFGADDIDFESLEFSRTFYVRAPNKRWAYDVLHPRAMEFLLQSPRFSIEFGSSRWGIAYRKERFAPHEFEEAYRVLAGLYERLPGYLVKERKGRS